MGFEFALARGHVDSATEWRGQVNLGKMLREDPGAVSVLLCDEYGRLAVVENMGVFELWRPPVELFKTLGTQCPAENLWFMGRDAAGVVQVTLSVPANANEPLTAALAAAPITWRHITEFGALLTNNEDSLIATQSTALAAWHRATRFCSACATELEPTSSGWTRTCPACAKVEYPRIDPAVIVDVRDNLDRLLLLHNVAWPSDRMSLLAGYVDAGETPERAVRREVMEEVGLEVTRVAYLGAQPWPRPRSLMLSFAALVDCPKGQFGNRDSLAVPQDSGDCPDPMPDQIEIDRAHFFTRAELRQAVTDGSLKVPGPSAVAHTIIDRWLREDGGVGLDHRSNALSADSRASAR